MTPATCDLLPRHVQVLADSGISPERAAAAGIRSVSADEVSARLERRVKSGGLEFAYPGTRHVRYRLDEPLVYQSGEVAKYLSASGSSNRLYVPDGVEAELTADSTRPLYIVEGEKKCVAVRVSTGLSCVGVAGAWGWRTKSEGPVIRDLHDLAPRLQGRLVVIAFDSDARVNVQIARAANGLATWLREQGVGCVRWAFPPHDGRKKQGLDDVLVTHGVETLLEVLQQPIAPCEPWMFMVRCFAESLASDTDDRARVGTPEFERLQDLLGHVSSGMRRALADEVRRSLDQPASWRDALLEVACPDSASSDRLVRLADEEPWAEPVDGPALLDTILATIRLYVVVDDDDAVALALWTAFSWTSKCFHHSPRLLLVSPTHRCGKTTLLTLLRALTRRPLMTANISSAAIFRVIERDHPTLLIDEFDSFGRGREDLRNILNAGHVHDEVVIRLEGDDHRVCQYRTSCPVALASIGKPARTLVDRSIEVSMRRQPPRKRAKRLRGDRIGDDLLATRQMLRRWSDDSLQPLSSADPVLPSELDDRAADNWRPLIAIADQVGGSWPERGRRAATQASASRADVDASEPGVRLLADIREAFGTRERITTKQLLAALTARDESPWRTCSRDNGPLHAQHLARLLRPFDIKARPIRVGTRTPRGYLRESFVDAWDRYLETPERRDTATSPQPSGGGGSRRIDRVQHAPGVAGRGSASTSGADCAVAELRLRGEVRPAACASGSDEHAKRGRR